MTCRGWESNRNKHLRNLHSAVSYTCLRYSLGFARLMSRICRQRSCGRGNDPTSDRSSSYVGATTCGRRPVKAIKSFAGENSIIPGSSLNYIRNKVETRQLLVNALLRTRYNPVKNNIYYRKCSI